MPAIARAGSWSADLRSSNARGAKTSRGTLEFPLARSPRSALLEACLELAQDLVAVEDEAVLGDLLARGERRTEARKGGLQFDRVDHECMWGLARSRGGGADTRL